MSGLTKMKTELASEVRGLLFELLTREVWEYKLGLERRRLTLSDARGLWSLDVEVGQAIGSLAQDWGCDPTNVTYIVNRLVRAGLAARTKSGTDRRVILVRLTSLGSQVKEDILGEFHAPIDNWLRLGNANLEAIAALLRTEPSKRVVRPL